MLYQTEISFPRTVLNIGVRTLFRQMPMTTHLLCASVMKVDGVTAGALPAAVAMGNVCNYRWKKILKVLRLFTIIFLLLGLNVVLPNIKDIFLNHDY